MELHKKVYGGWLDILEGLGEGLGEEHLGGAAKGLSKIIRGSILMNYEIEVQRKMAEDHEAQEKERERKEEEYRAKVESKFDRVESKLDREEEKIDVETLKIDFVKTLVDRLEGKTDRVMQLIDKVEGKADRLEGKLDKVEAKLDHMEGKVDMIEVKGDRIEGKLDRFEPKVDKIELKLDKMEPKVDKLERKIDILEPKIDLIEPKIDKIEPKLDQVHAELGDSKEFWQYSPSVWTVRRAKRVGVRVQNAPRSSEPTTWAFNVESIQIPVQGARIVKIIVDGVGTDLTGHNIVSPSNVMIDSGLGIVGASNWVKIEFHKPYTGPVEFNGQKPMRMRLCTVVEGTGSSQKSPNPCGRS